MSKSTTTNREQRQARWRKRIDRQAASGRSVAAFCRDESIPVQSFYWWRARLGKASVPPHARAGVAPFIDLGAMAGRGAAQAASASAGIELRLELPGGITLTIARR